MTPEDRLRAVLHAHAARVEPGRDGLERIRAGITRRPRWRRLIDRMKKARAGATARAQSPTNR
ncbi:hypothetical protein SAMN04489712_105248 [Thermomonospora echinospora]|uniref:Uncharacterized protein n=1 Tax=Thermomonospora echinospora TaxID=1992 RepID=A0A1H6A6L6_9ACTN|nr:hypothetical protein [Thermomonospora echinospora]SEG44368.1 hypothetical protein SAMN04489712_105248 [Thermomonospora echinospora]